MPGIRVEDNTTRALISALDGLSARQRTISNNIANVDTPGFKASDVSFARQLENVDNVGRKLQMTVTDSQHLSAAGLSEETEVFTRKDTSQRVDGNNVDVEKEMAYLAETSLHYQTVTRLVSRRLAGLRTVINEGRR